MTIMRRCCCFNDTRSGTLASAIYTLLYTIIFLALAGWGFTVWNWPWTPSIVITMFYIEFVAYALVFVTSIIAVVGVSKDIAGLLMPYIICLALMMIIEGACYITWLVLLGFAAIVLIIPFVFFLGLLGLNICCLLCAISQYQELSAGRGRIGDVAAANTTTTVIMTSGQPVMTQPPPGVFVVSGQQQQQHTVVQQYGQVQMQPVAYGQQPVAYVQQPVAYVQQPVAYGQPPPAYGQPVLTSPGQPMQQNQSAPPLQAPVYDQPGVVKA